MPRGEPSSSDSGRCFVVSGGASGIGGAVARRLAADGHTVAIIDLNIDAAHETAANLGDRHLAVQADLGEERQVVAAFATIASRFPTIHGLAACAGINDMTPFEELDSEIFARIYRVNVIGTFLCMREAVKLIGAGGGRICTVSSVAGLRGGGIFGTAAYSASKGAIIALTKTAARTLAPRCIAVNCVVPGPVETPMLLPHWQDEQQRLRVQSLIPIGRPGTPDEVANTICWLLSPDASLLTGTTLVADGGMIMH